MSETRENINEVLMEPYNLETRDSSKRILHFSDGVLEECTAEEDYVTESDGNATDTAAVVDPSSLSWGPWLWHKTVSASSSALKTCDYLGETLADFFGITTPKYQLEIDEYKRMVQQEEEEKQRQDLEMGGWRDKTSTNVLGKTTDLGTASLPLSPDHILKEEGIQSIAP